MQRQEFWSTTQCWSESTKEEKDGLNFKNNDNNRKETETQSTAWVTRLALSTHRRFKSLQKRIRRTRWDHESRKWTQIWRRLFVHEVSQKSVSRFVLIMIFRGTKEWSYFIELVDSNVDASEALRMTREKFPRSVVEQMNKDLRNHGIERDWTDHWCNQRRNRFLARLLQRHKQRRTTQSNRTDLDVVRQSKLQTEWMIK